MLNELLNEIVNQYFEGKSIKDILEDLEEIRLIILESEWNR